MPQRQNPEVRQQEVMPMFQNRDVTTAAVILNNVIGSSFPRQAMNLVTPMDEPIPMGHDCTRCAAVSTCSLLNIVNENGGDNPIARRMKAIDMIKADNPDFIQKTSAEEREVLIKEKMMALKEQDLKQNIAQESETPVAQMEQLHTPQLSIVTEIKKTEKETTDPQTIDITNARNQDNYEPTHIPSPMEVEVNPVTPNSVHGASLPRLNRGLHSGHFHDHFVINTNSSPLLPTGHSGNGVKPKSIPAPIPSKQELKPKPNVKKPTLPITIQIESARKPFQRPNTNTRQIKPLEKRTGIVIPQTDKKIAAADIIHGEKRKSLQDLSPVIIIQNIPFPRHLLIKQK